MLHAIMDCIVHNAAWVETGTVKMRKHAGSGWSVRSRGTRDVTVVYEGGAH